MRVKARNYTIKEIALELQVHRVYLHRFLRKYKPLFKTPGNCNNKVRKTKYSEAERLLILQIWDKAPYTHREKNPI